ncbi:MAG TPA: hypothetical protein PLY50_16405 [Burkholderiaceae bacterium]|nr:hypothetical protein [Burkholderiaceae bacterium]
MGIGTIHGLEDADELQLTSLTRALDKPMRNASDNEQMFAAILHELQSSTMRQP